MHPSAEYEVLTSTTTTPNVRNTEVVPVNVKLSIYWDMLKYQMQLSTTPTPTLMNKDIHPIMRRWTKPSRYIDASMDIPFDPPLPKPSPSKLL
jgi:hypothetical protein